MFHCYASGWPSPSLVWLKDGKEIRNGDADNSYVLRKQPGGLDLTIFYVRQTVHEGKYTCVARNQYGKKRHSILLSVPGVFAGRQNRWVLVPGYSDIYMGSPFRKQSGMDEEKGESLTFVN